MKSRLRCLLLCTLFSLLSLFQLFAAWQPGLRCGYHLHGNDFARAPIWTNSALDTVAATNWCGWGISSAAPVVTNGAQTSVWSLYRAWYYWGEIYLEAGEVAFCGYIDDAIVLEIDGKVILRNESNGEAFGKRTFAEAGWHSFSLKVADFGGGAGPSGQQGFDGTGFGFAIKERGATEWSYPADDGTMSRYRHDDGTGFPDLLVVSGSPAAHGVPEPAYGETWGCREGETIRCSAPESFHDANVDATLTGYLVRTNEISKAEYAKGTSSSFELVYPGVATYLEWLYRCRYRVTVETTAGGTVAQEGGWFDFGTSCTLTAVPDAGAIFMGWSGDLPEGIDRDASVLTFVVDRSRAITAMFKSPSLQPKVFSGPTEGSWDDAGNWTPAGVPTFADSVHIPSGIRVAASLTAYAGELTVSNGAALSLYGKTTARDEYVEYTETTWNALVGTDDHGREALSFDPCEGTLTLKAGDIRLLDSAELIVGGHGQKPLSSVIVKGDLSLGDHARLDLYPGLVKGYYKTATPGATLAVAGRTTIADGAVVTLYNHLRLTTEMTPDNGSAAPVFLDLHETVIARGAVIRAHAGMTYLTGREKDAPWQSSIGSTSDGASHGGQGGTIRQSDGSLNRPRRPVYGNPLAPILPGASARSYNTMGGGVIRLHATDLTVDGTIDSSATLYVEMHEHGGAAGGSTWITCDSLAVGPEGRFVSRGQEAPFFQEHNCGGGGGGRIAVGVGLSPEQISSLALTGRAEGLTPAADLASVYRGQVDVSGGPGAFRGEAGTDGTALFYRAKREDVVSLSVTAEPAELRPGVEASPALGLHEYEAGSAITAAAPEGIVVTESGDTRRACVGYKLTDLSGRLLAEGGGATCTIAALECDATLTWYYGENEFLVSTESIGAGAVTGGGWYSEGETAVLSAIPAQGSAFLTFVAPFLPDHGSIRDGAFSFPVLAPGTFTACFKAPSSPLAGKVYVGPDGGSWDVPENWEPVGLPTFESAVEIPSGTVVDLPVRALVGSLKLGPGAVLSVFGRSTAEKEPVVLTGSNSIEAGRLAHDIARGDPIGLVVFSDLVVSEGARLSIGGFDQFRPARLFAGGSIRFAEASSFQIYPGPVDQIGATLLSGGARVEALGEISFATNVIATAFGHLVTQPNAVFGGVGPVTFSAGSFRLAHGALLQSLLGASLRTGLTIGLSAHGDDQGAAHGGLGGGGTAGKTAGKVYDAPYAPLLPGCYGRGQCNFGGGAIRVHAGTIVLGGTIDVSSRLWAIQWEQAGGSGGSIWMTADAWHVKPTARLLARGMDAQTLWGTDDNPRFKRGGGGGGRIALARYLTDEDIASLYRTGDVAREIEKKELGPDFAFFHGTLDVDGGRGVLGAADGQPGTAWLLDDAPEATLLLLR